MADHFYVTTPIYYVNAVPHLGTFYTTTVADALARYHRARRHETYFLTGTDEHGQKIERLAQQMGISPKEYCDGIVAKFKETWERMGVSYDRFIRTTDPDHHAAVEAMWQRISASGDIYLADYDAMYCVGCEGWKTEEEVVVEEGNKLCPLHRKPVERVREQNYFFRLSKYADKLLALYGQPGFIRPESRKNEVTEFVKSGLRDLSISRTSVKWGIPVPNDPKHVVYVWLDALTNYVSALGGPDRVLTDPHSQALWGACTHLIAKDILRFHAVYWPAFLMSAGLPPPKGVFCHGYITVKGQKISKSIPATRVDPNLIAGALGADTLRYFVLREYSLGGDGDFTYEALFQRHESDLGNDLGNLVNRTISMARTLSGDGLDAAHRSGYSAGDPFSEEELVLRNAAREATLAATKAWDDFQPSRALEATWSMIRAGNVYLDRTAPWKLKKAGQTAELRDVLANTCEVIRRAAIMVAPAMPAAAREILRQIGREQDVGLWPFEDWGGWPGGKLCDPKPIFPRLEPDRQKELIATWLDQTPPVQVAVGASAPGQPVAEITIEDFKRMDLRAAKVLQAEAVPKTDKLLKLTLDLGGEQRIVISGIAGAYAPTDLIGRTVLYLANLKPTKIRGVMSQGMILAGSADNVLALCSFDREVPPGAKAT
jgi:methionyl-tRNA synthetase/methionyl-tRNA synthetase C-terminal region/beta chain